MNNCTIDKCPDAVQSVKSENLELGSIDKFSIFHFFPCELVALLVVH